MTTKSATIAKGKTAAHAEPESDHWIIRHWVDGTCVETGYTKGRNAAIAMMHRMIVDNRCRLE